MTKNKNQNKLYHRSPKYIVFSSIAFVSISALIINFLSAYFDVDILISKLNIKSPAIFLVFIVQAILLLLPVVYYYKKRIITLEDLGFKKTSITKSIALIITAFICFLIINAIILQIITKTQINIPGYGQQVDYLPIFGEDKYSIIVAFITVSIIAPLTEEIFFRGLIQGQLNKLYAPLTSISLTGFIFAFSHLQLQVLIPLFIVGTIISAIYHKSASIYTPIAFHSLNNTLALSLAIYLQ